MNDIHLRDNGLEEEEICEEIECKANSAQSEHEVAIQSIEMQTVASKMMPLKLDWALLTNEHLAAGESEGGQCDAVTELLELESCSG